MLPEHLANRLGVVGFEQRCDLVQRQLRSTQGSDRLSSPYLVDAVATVTRGLVDLSWDQQALFVVVAECAIVSPDARAKAPIVMSSVEDCSTTSERS
jgi:hypothetical protein